MENGLLVETLEMQMKKSVRCWNIVIDANRSGDVKTVPPARLNQPFVFCRVQLDPSWTCPRRVGVTNPEHDSYWSEHQASPTSPLHASAKEEYWSWDESTTGYYWGWESRPSRVAQLTMAMHPALMRRKNDSRVLCY